MREESIPQETHPVDESEEVQHEPPLVYYLHQ